jgi:hypothetical protein
MLRRRPPGSGTWYWTLSANRDYYRVEDAVSALDSDNFDTMY